MTAASPQFSRRCSLSALDSYDGTVVITGVNADPGAGIIRASLQDFATGRPSRVALLESLGSRRYLSLMRHVDAVVGKLIQWLNSRRRRLLEFPQWI